MAVVVVVADADAAHKVAVVAGIVGAAAHTHTAVVAAG